jgi:hypothetical protein
MRRNCKIRNVKERKMLKNDVRIDIKAHKEFL